MTMAAENHQNSNKGITFSDTTNIKLVALGTQNSANKYSSESSGKQNRKANEQVAQCYRSIIFFSTSGLRDVYLESTNVVQMAVKNWRCPLLLRFSGSCLVQYWGYFGINQSEMVARLSPEASLIQHWPVYPRQNSVLLIILLQLTFCSP